MVLWRALPRGADLSRSLAGVATLLSNELPLGGVVLLHLDMQVLRPRLVAEGRLAALRQPRPGSGMASRSMPCLPGTTTGGQACQGPAKLTMHSPAKLTKPSLCFGAPSWMTQWSAEYHIAASGV